LKDKLADSEKAQYYSGPSEKGVFSHSLDKPGWTLFKVKVPALNQRMGI